MLHFERNLPKTGCKYTEDCQDPDLQMATWWHYWLHVSINGAPPNEAPVCHGSFL